MSQWIAEDYYWQLMMQLLIEQSGQQTKGYFEAPLEIIRLQRSPFGKHLACSLSINALSYDELFAQWQAKEIEILSPPTTLPFGYTFVAIDPDGHRLRVISLNRA